MKTQPESKCPELLANYCDMLLRKTPLSKKLTSEEIELKLKEVVRQLRQKHFLCLIIDYNKITVYHTDAFRVCRKADVQLIVFVCLSVLSLLADVLSHLPSSQLLVLKYVQNKDVFMRYHKAHLTRRLILDISADSEIEENMVEWLRVSKCQSQRFLFVLSVCPLFSPLETFACTTLTHTALLMEMTTGTICLLSEALSKKQIQSWKTSHVVLTMF